MEKVKKAALSVLAALAIICLTVGFMFSLPAATAYADEPGSNVSTDADAGTGSGEGTGEGTGENTETDPAPEEGTTEGVATIGETSYATLQAAIDAATSGQTVTLIKDVTENIKTAADDVITLDLNGYTLTNASDHTIMNYGKLTIVDGSEAGTVDNVTHARGALFNFGEATLLGGTFTRSLEDGSSATDSGGNSWYVIKNLGYLTIGAEGEQCDVSVTQDGHVSSMITNGYYDPDDQGDHATYYASVTTEDKIPTLVINGGTFSGGINTVKNDNHSVAVINGGKFTNVSQAVVLNWNDLTITGGEFVAGKDAQAAIITSYANTGFNNGTTNITGGNFDGAIMADYNDANVDYSISGGTFSATVPGDYIAANAMLVSDGENGYVVGDAQEIATEQQKDYYVANGIAYESLPAAVAAVPTDNKQVTITLVDGNDDAKLSGDGVKVQANQNIVIDFNGNTYDVSGATVGSSGTETNGFQLLKGATVEMKNGTVTATSSTAKLLIQKYCDLTLRGMVVDGRGLVNDGANYVVSNNNGTTTFAGNTIVYADEGDYAFDVYYWPKNGYTEVKVVFADDFTGTIDGDIQYASDGSEGWFENASLEINGSGTFNGELKVGAEGDTALEANITISGGTFVQEVPADYLAEDALYYKDASGNFVFMDKETAEEEGYVITLNGYGYTSIDAAVAAGAEAYIDLAEGVDVAYETLDEALEAAKEGETVKMLADYTTKATLQINKKITLDLNGYSITGGSTADNLVIKIAAGGAKITNSSADESVVTLGAREVVGIGVAADLTEEVTIENIMVEATDKTKTDSVLNGLELSSPTTVKGVTINVSGKTTSTDLAKSYLMMAILAQKDVTIIDSNITATQTEGSTNQLQAVRVEAGANLTMEGTKIDANGPLAYGVCFFGPYSTAEFNRLLESDPLDTSKFTTLSITNSSIEAYAFAVTGNGATHGTIFDIENSTLVSEAGSAIYHPQYGEMTVSASTITGTSGIEVRAGIVTIESSIITATGDPFVSDPNGNGSTTDGAAISLVQHTTELPTQITVKSGTFNGVRAFYQANLQGNDAAALEKIAINLQGGTYNGEVYSENKTGYITGGQYRDLPAEDAFLEGYAGELFNGYYVVVESGEAGDTADLLAMRLEAQADVRLYAVALGLNWADVSGDADIAAAYAAINTATSESIIALAKAQAMDAVDVYYNTIVDARAEAIEAIEQAAGSDVTVPTATYAAINGAMSAEEIAYYRENALAEIQAIRSLRTEITAQAGELEGIAAAVERLEGAFAGQGGEFDSLLGDIRAAITAAQEAIESGTSEALQDMQAALEAKIDAGTQAVKDAVSGVMEELTQLAESVAAGDKALQEAIAAGEKALAEQIEAVQGDIGALEGAVDGQASDLQASIDALESAVGEQASAVQADIDALRTAIAAAQADIDDILASIAAGGPSFEELAEQIAAIKSTADGLQTSVGDVQTAVKAAQDAVAAAQGALSGQIEEADDAASFTTLYVLVGIALALSAAAVALLVVLLLKRSKAA